MGQLKKLIHRDTGVVEMDASIVRQVRVDSREVMEGDVFFAIPGDRFDGADFIGKALSRGALCAVAARVPEGIDPSRVLLVDDPMDSLSVCADAYYGHPSSSMKVIGVTGTNGKTTVTYLLEAICREGGGVPGVIGTIQYRIGETTLDASLTTPFPHQLQSTLAKIRDKGGTHVFMEVSSHGISQKRIGGIKFDGGVFTNLSRDHLDFHGDMESYFHAKKSFFTDVLPRGGEEGNGVINIDSPFGTRLIGELGGEFLSFGMSGDADVNVVTSSFSISGTRAVISTPGGKVNVESSLIGVHNLSNILAATACAYWLGIDGEQIEKGLSSVDSIPGRMERVDVPGNASIFVDYAHSPSGLEQVISALLRFKKKRLILVFGCGGDRDRGKRPLMGEVAGRLADVSFVTNDNPRSEDPLSIIDEILPGCEKGGALPNQEMNVPNGQRIYLVEPDRKMAIEKAIALSGEGDILLVAGKGHETYQLVGNEKKHFDDREVIRQSNG